MKIRYISVLVFISSIVVTSLFWKNNILLFIILLILSLIILYIDNFKFLKTYICCGLFGAFAEIVAVTTNPWIYTNPSIMRIPIWLPLLWGIASISFIKVAIHNNEIRYNK